MPRIHSSYKFFGGFGLLLFLNVITGFGTFELLSDSKISVAKFDFDDTNVLYVYSIMLSLNLLFLFVLATQCKFLIVDGNGLTSVNPLLPFLTNTKHWDYFDYYITVDEYS
jgi:hypothetical protein